MARSLRPVVLLAAAVLLSRCSGCGSDEPTCPSGQEVCHGVCTDTATYAADPLNCGGCAISCGNGTCAGGQCDCGAETYCPASNPRCADLQADRLNCGACGHACPRANDVCQGGTCQCLSPFTECSATVCTNTQTDAGNCNGCGNVCPLANAACNAGECGCGTSDIACPQPNPTACVNPSTDEANCLGCGNVCAAGASCSPTGCLCPTDESVCGTAPGVCVNTHTDEANCGSCGTVCATGATCTNSSCTCPQGAVACGGTQAGGKCCAGDACCAGNTCQPQHSNGVGGSYFDCVALGTYDATQAGKAASSWQPGGHAFPGSLAECPGCIGWQTPDGVSPAFCGTWCYSGPLQGKVVVVQSLVCTCAGLNPGTWN